MNFLKNALLVLTSSFVLVWTVVTFWNPIMWFLAVIWTGIIAFLTWTTTALFIFGFFFGTPVALYVWWLSRKPAKFRREEIVLHCIVVTFFLLVSIMAVRGHFLERSRMEPLRQAFIAKAQGGNPVINAIPHYGGGTLDYGGKVTSLKDVRDTESQHDGFLFLGSWWASEPSSELRPRVTTWGIYLWAPWRALM